MFTRADYRQTLANRLNRLNFFSVFQPRNLQVALLLVEKETESIFAVLIEKRALFMKFGLYITPKHGWQLANGRLY